MKVVVLPLSYSLYNNPTLVGGHTTHIVEFVNALANMPEVDVTLLYPKSAGYDPPLSRVQVIDTSSLVSERQFRGKLGVVVWNIVAVRFIHLLLHELCKEQGVDVYYVRFAPSSILPLAMLWYLGGNATITLEINTPSFMTLPGLTGCIIDRSALQMCTKASVVSQDLRQLMVRKYGKIAQTKIFVNPNGANVRLFKPLGQQASLDFRVRHGLKADEFIVGFSGVALPHHRLDSVARCVSRLGSGCRFVIAGDTRAVDTHRIFQAGHDKILLLGQIPYVQVPEFLNACDVLVLPYGPSYEQVLHQSPIKMFEYMAMAKPVVASRIGQIVDVIKDGENGLLFDWWDEASLVRLLRELRENPELRERLGTRARETVVKGYTWDANARRFLQAIGYAQSAC